ncbi:hypothetical protein ACJZ2D_005448 [Fusarium nematophilum]
MSAIDPMCTRLGPVCEAKVEDIETITELYLLSFSEDPQWNYRFPYHSQYPEDSRAWTRRFFEELLKPDRRGYVVVNVIEAAQDRQEAINKSISLAIWEIETLGISRPIVLTDSGSRRDASPARLTAFSNAASEARKTISKVLKDENRTSHLHLRFLCTHADYRRLGAATQHCQWGMDWAAEEGIPVTLFCSSMAQDLYASLGFKLLTTVTAKVEDKDSLCPWALCSTSHIRLHRVSSLLT